MQKARKTVEIEGRKPCVFRYYDGDPKRYSVAEFDPVGIVLSFCKKPSIARSNYAGVA